MGITGLLPFLKKSSRPAHVRELSHATVAIDVYCWLHKGAFSCADRLGQNLPTNGYVLYVMKYVNLLLFHNVKPILVFDGRNLPSKAGTEKKRRENRQKYRTMAVQYLREGKAREATECFQKCVDVTPAMAREVIQACQARNVDCIVAPYEADAQLAFLNLSGLAQYVITEDSDLTLFGCEKILFKLDKVGNGVLYEKSNLHLALGQNADAFTFEKFRYMCIMSGCDYQESLKGIGLAKSFKFWSRASNPVLEQVLLKIPSYLNMPQHAPVSKEYVDGFLQANRTFKYQLVFDPRSRRLRPLNDYPVNERLGDLSFAGGYLEDGIALQMALGNLELRDLGQVNRYDPDILQQGGEQKTAYGKRATHESIWNSSFDPAKAVLIAATKALEEKEKKENVTTAFGVFKKENPTRQKLPLLVEAAANVISSTPIKRKVEKLSSGDETPRIDISSQHRDGGDYKRQKLDPPLAASDGESPEKVVVSRYWLPKPSPTLKVSATPQEKTRKDDKKSKTSGCWLSELDSVQSAEGKFIYRTEQLEPVEVSESEATKENGGARKSSLPARLDISTPFKPAIAQPKDVTEELRKKRNPFAKTTPEKTPPRPNSESQESSTLPSSQLSTFSIEAESFNFTQKSLDSSSPGSSQSEQLLKSFPSSQGESGYFKKVSLPASSKAGSSGKRMKPKGVSGLMRGSSSSSSKQLSVADMFKKKV
jgi:exonuclease-1